PISPRPFQRGGGSVPGRVVRNAETLLVGHIAGTRVQVEVPDEVLAARRRHRAGDLRLNIRDREQPRVDLDSPDDAVELLPSRIASPRYSIHIGALPDEYRRRRRIRSSPGRIGDRMLNDLARVGQIPVELVVSD